MCAARRVAAFRGTVIAAIYLRIVSAVYVIDLCRLDEAEKIPRLLFQTIWLRRMGLHIPARPPTT